VPRAGLSRPILIAEAAQLADEVGFDGLTLAALAGRFGVAVPSLYKHVDGLDDVRRGVAAGATEELGLALTQALAGASRRGARGRLRALADAYRGYAHDHPGRYAATLRAPATTDAEHLEASDALVGTVFGVLAERGLSGDAAVDATRALRAALHGFVSLEAAGGFGMPRDIERSFARLVDTLDRGLAAGAERAPRSTAGQSIAAVSRRT
jgi:AcrR family transcriptional regulator